MNDHTVDRILSILAIILSPFASLYLAKRFSKREREVRERLDLQGAEVTVFEAHLSAFRLRVEQLEAREKELEEALDKALERVTHLEDQNGRLLRENYKIRGERDDCLDRERKVPR